MTDRGDGSGLGEPGLLATDFYQLSMLHAYQCSRMEERAIFEFFCRRLPASRGYLIAAGLATLLERLETACFSEDELDWLRSGNRFPPEAIDRFAAWRFTGDVDAVPEGTLVFADEPIVRVEAQIAEAQLIETLVISYLHYQTLVASKAARMVLAAPDATLIDFGLRRAHSLGAGTYAARAAYLAGFHGTATMSAGRLFGIPVSGTMAHSFIQAHDSERAAFEDFALARPSEAIFLIDTYDTDAAARTLVEMAPSLRMRGVTIRAVRIDSGDLAAHARSVRMILDQAGLTDVKIVASGGIDEWSLERFTQEAAPIDTFGVGTSLVTSQDLPALDCAYKLVAYAGFPRRKRSEGKVLWPGAKQVFRSYDAEGQISRDVLALAHESLDGEPLLRPVMRQGRRLSQPSLTESRATAKASLDRLPQKLRALGSCPPHRVDISDELRGVAETLSAQGR